MAKNLSCKKKVSYSWKHLFLLAQILPLVCFRMQVGRGVREQQWSCQEPSTPSSGDSSRSSLLLPSHSPFFSVSPLFSSLLSLICSICSILIEIHLLFCLCCLWKSASLSPHLPALSLWTVSWPTPPCGRKEWRLFTAAVKEHRKICSCFGFFFLFLDQLLVEEKQVYPTTILPNNFFFFFFFILTLCAFNLECGAIAKMF